MGPDGVERGQPQVLGGGIKQWRGCLGHGSAPVCGALWLDGRQGSRFLLPGLTGCNVCTSQHLHVHLGTIVFFAV